MGPPVPTVFSHEQVGTFFPQRDLVQQQNAKYEESLRVNQEEVMHSVLSSIGEAKISAMSV